MIGPRRVAALVLVGSVLVAGTPSNAPAQAAPESLTLPGVATTGTNTVPLATVVQIASRKAKEIWGEATPGAPIPCADQDGNLAYYMVPFHFGPGPFPSYERVMSGVREGRRFVEMVRRGQATRLDYHAALRDARHREMGIGEYGTVFVAATYDRFPIPLITNYLAPYYLTGDVAQQEARRHVRDEPVLTRIYFLGERGTYFEFVAGTETVTIHAFTVERAPIVRAPRSTATAEQEEAVKREWRGLTAPP